MPTYEYLCRTCGERLEVVQSFSDAALTVCGACGGELRKVFSAAGLIFKGSGWHIKDYSSSSSAPTATKDPATKKDGGDAKDTSTSAKPSSSEKPSSPAPASTPSTSGSGSA